MADKRTLNEKLADKNGIGRGGKTTDHAGRTSKDARHEGAKR